MEIISKRLVISNLSAGDFHFYSRLVSDEKVMQYITGKALTLEEAESRFQLSLYGVKGYSDTGFFIIKHFEDQEFVGMCKLVQFDESAAEIGYMLLPEWWGKGYASEIVESLLELVKAKNYSNEIVGLVDPGNLASINVLAKFGFEHYKTGQNEGLPTACYRLKLVKQ